MKTYNNLIDKICDFENLGRAYRKARLGRRFNPEILSFSNNLEENLIILGYELSLATYRTGRYKEFMVYDPKPRIVMSLPFRDRVAQHAICNVIEPLFDRKFIYDTYACRQGKGVIVGVLRSEMMIHRAMRNYDTVFVLKGDVKKYFYSLNHAVLKNDIRRTIRCQKTLAVLDGIIDSSGDGVGIPIGNLTSQLFANIYLDPLDHLIKETLGIKYYVRYMDDFIILGGSKKYLWNVRRSIQSELASRGLELNRKTVVFPLSKGIDFLGYRHFPDFRLLRKRNISKTRRKFRKLTSLFKRGEIDFTRVDQSVQSFIGHAKWANSYQARKRVLEEIKL